MAIPAKPFRLVAIDDDEDDQLILQRWLRRSKMSPVVKLFNSGSAAIEYLKALSPNSSELPHVIFCDIKMPGIDGFQFLQWLRRSQHRHLPVVMRSSSPLHTDIAKAYQLGANSYVEKRVGLQAMEERITDLVHYWMDVAEVPGR